MLALFEAPALLWQALPMILQLAFAFFFIAFQFIGLFWLLSRGGVDTYYPDDIKTRFSDVWGQDHVVAADPREHHVPGEAGRDRGARAATSPAASCCGARPAPARR